MISLSAPKTFLQQTTQSMIDTMDEIDYAFYLAYGMTPEDEELESLLDVEMYNIMDADVPMQVEESHSHVLPCNA